MDRKQLIEQNLNIFLENYIADLLHYYAKNDEQIAHLISQKKELASALKNVDGFLDYDEIQNAILHTIATLLYKNGFDDAIDLHKKLQ